MPTTFSRKFRRPLAHLSSYVTNHLFYRKPWVVMWWSAAFPGFGHLMLCKYFSGFLLMGWEFFINLKAHLNDAIFYSMLGKFDMAKEVLDTRWFLLYISVYIFTLRDCYNLTLDLNKFTFLAQAEDSAIMPFNISPLELNYLKVRNHGSGVVWSLFAPGVGYLYINRLPSGFFILLCYVLIAYYSHMPPAIHATFMGDFRRAKEVLEPQWFLFLPSVIGFSAYDVYIHTKALNGLFKAEQSRFLTDNYQTAAIKLPFNREWKEDPRC